MGGEQAAMVLTQIKSEADKIKGKAPEALEKSSFQAGIQEQYETQGHPYYASARLWDDGIIDPKETRRVLGLGLALSEKAAHCSTKFGIFIM
jgi:3-methylcrotonyl-CoA carboxylase beta subunit